MFRTTSLGAMYNNLGFTSMSTHNVYLQLLAETGIVGLVLFLVPAAVTLIAGDAALGCASRRRNVRGVVLPLGLRRRADLFLGLLLFRQSSL